MWQLKKLSNGEALNEPQKLPENWGPIFGMAGVQDRLGDLSWLGDAYVEQGWFVVGEALPDTALTTAAEAEWERAKSLLAASDWTMLPDVPLTVEDKRLWEAYRRQLREIRLQPEFPNNIQWPVAPQ